MTNESPVRALFCGSRLWRDREPILARLRGLPVGSIVIHGAAPGADAIAGEEADCLGLRVMSFPADWNGLGRSAGPIRNQRMIDEGRPSIVFAFPMQGSRGTWDMVRRARTAGIAVVIGSGNDHR